MDSRLRQQSEWFNMILFWHKTFASCKMYAINLSHMTHSSAQLLSNFIIVTMRSGQNGNVIFDDALDFRAAFHFRKRLNAHMPAPMRAQAQSISHCSCIWARRIIIPCNFHFIAKFHIGPTYVFFIMMTSDTVHELIMARGTIWTMRRAWMPCLWISKAMRMQTICS